MKLNHTNTMKDNDKPEAPEGYTVMLGEGVPIPVPQGTLVDSMGFGWLPSECIGGKVDGPDRDLWYAVPAVKNDKPEAPEGYTVMLGRDVPHPIPRDLLAWFKGKWEDTDFSGLLGYPNIHYPEAWFALPNDPACTMIRDMAMKEKRNADPKASQAIQKPQLQLIPPTLNEETAKALSHGGIKYSPWNWRENRVEIMTYLGAMKRHIDCLIEGEDIDPDTGAHHLGCVAAGCGIVLDARKHGTLVDNRPPKGQNT